MKPIRALGRYMLKLRVAAAQRRELRRWERSGRPVPPPHAVKQRVLRAYAHAFGPRVLVETGTYMGDMVAAMLDQFDRIYSIELSEELHARARARFADEPRVTILQGDSARVLPELLKELGVPCLFWLDGHYSSGVTALGDRETPVEQELRAILTHTVRGHVVLIDDARQFVGEGDWPAISTIESTVHAIDPRLVVRVEDDIIRVHPPGSSAS
ncbi:MAG TPA: class I SAM-dependent methyltransferase [Chloroflexota bacterium]|nr:class I SAM-dependent methyltransferase [Chloroflexota bacterium]